MMVAVAVGVGLAVSVGVGVGVGLTVALESRWRVILGLGNGVGHTVLLVSSLVTNALVVPAANALLPNWKAFLVTGKSPEKVRPAT